MQLPSNDGTPLIRTDFSSDEAWQRVVEAASAEIDGVVADLDVVDDRRFADADPIVLAEAANASNAFHVLLFIADSRTINNADLPLLCILPNEPGIHLRLVPEQVKFVWPNIFLGNMDLYEYADAADSTGVFRGFDE